MKGNNLIPIIAIAVGGILVFSAVQNKHPLDLVKNALQGKLVQREIRPISTRAFSGNKPPSTGTPKIAPRSAQDSRR